MSGGSINNELNFNSDIVIGIEVQDAEVVVIQKD